MADLLSQPSISFGYHDAPRDGLGLATDIIVAIRSAWKDTNNIPLTKPSAQRQVPFYDWEFRVRPNFQPPRSLTPNKVGLALCWILHRLLQVPYWPGHVLARIFEGEGQQKRQIGSVNIDNVPVRGESVSNGSALAFPTIQLTQRWLRCFEAFQSVVIPHSPNAHVTDDLRFPPRPEVRRYPLPCGSPGVADRIDFFIYPTANERLSWSDVMDGLVSWIKKVATYQESGLSTKFSDKAYLLAEVSVYIQKPAGSDQLDGSLVSTA
ncbi:MAG: hypothetical protein Q9218_005266 [Villophora microphyllina]